MRLTILLFSSLLLGTACTKEVEKIVVQEKRYSWSGINAFDGDFNILLGSAKGPGGLYFQQPTGFAALEGRPGQPLSLTQYAFPGPTDILVRYPIGNDFFVVYYDSLVSLVPNTRPVESGAGGWIHLKKFDQQALRVQRNRYSFNKFAAISQHNYVLIPYETTTRDTLNHLLLAHVEMDGYANHPIYHTSAQLITLPIRSGIYPYMPTLLMAFDDYFLVDCGSEGVYKITESGQVRHILTLWGVDTFFKSQRLLWATLDNQRMAASADNGDTWQVFNNAPNLAFTTIHPVGDSLVGISHVLGGSLFSFGIDLAKQAWSIRPLKDDGLNQTAINGIETWGDTAYLATSRGLYKRPLNKLFESK